MESDTLRARIAAVLSREIPHIGVAADAVADAVIAELGLKREVERQRQYSWNPDRPTLHRYVTEWTADGR